MEVFSNYFKHGKEKVVPVFVNETPSEKTNVYRMRKSVPLSVPACFAITSLHLVLRTKMIVSLSPDTNKNR